mmetsp:Transcript_16996/g.20757  ORF Transcript_16996/g.20757 Transcript_16996/m.20757 type:complete len:469 (-) Transcript_16996:374-1780(-)
MMPTKSRNANSETKDTSTSEDIMPGDEVLKSQSNPDRTDTGTPHRQAKRKYMEEFSTQATKRFKSSSIVLGDISKRVKTSFLSLTRRLPQWQSPDSPSKILVSNDCIAQTLTVSDQHATILLTHQDNDSTGISINNKSTKSILKLTVVPFHREILGSNPVMSSQETQQVDLKLLQNNPQASNNIISFLRSYNFRLKSESGAEFSYYTATTSPKRFDAHQLFSSTLKNSGGQFNVELISPASDTQIRRSMPSHASALVHETPTLYNEVVKPYIQNITDGGSLNWIFNIIEGKKEQERLLVNSDQYIINIDTKWRSHPDTFNVPRDEWYNHKSVEDLYCLGIIKELSISTLRELTASHIPILKSMQEVGLMTIKKIYGVDPDQIRIFVHYHPQFYHFHVHFTRLQNEIGAQVERGHLLSDIIQNLEMDSNYYQKRTITYKLKVTSPLYLLLQQPSSTTVATQNGKDKQEG